MFSKRLPLDVLADWCRSVSSSMSAGITFVKALKITSRRGSQRVQAVSKRILQNIEQGDDVEDAILDAADSFPPIFVSLATVAVRTGHLPETLRHLENYFRFQLRLRRKFVAQIFWPVFQLVAAIFVIALLIYVLGIVQSIQGPDAIDLLGIGLTGGTGAVVWLVGCFGSIALAFITFHVVRNLMEQAPKVDALLLKIPTLGPCLKTLALSRLAFAMNLTMDSGMSVLEALPLSLAATNNGAFTSRGPEMVQQLRRGESLYETFTDQDIFTDEFLEVLRTGEESGTVPEAMERLSEQLNEIAEHQLTLLNTAIGWCVWLLVAIMITFFIFRIFLNYVNLINTAAQF